MLKETYHIPTLPPKVDFDTLSVLKKLNTANRLLAEVKGRAPIIPNQGILIDTLALQEARESSEIEMIVTTNDELFKASFRTQSTGPQKEVALYPEALRRGFESLSDIGAITNKSLIEMYQILKGRSDGFRHLPGTALKNNFNEIIYVPPQNVADIERHMSALEAFINSSDELDPLIRMAIIHHQFESIHPFPDGNGRLGRILNVLYLTKAGLLDIPILYMSRSVNRTKGEYYRLLQSVRDNEAWEEWVLYILDLVAESAQLTLMLIEGIRSQMAYFKQNIRNRYGFYSQDLINILFRYPYTRIEHVMHHLGVSRPTASSYLEKLASDKEIPITKHVEGRNNYYINVTLVELLSDIELDSLK